jgi:hypothetical protein
MIPRHLVENHLTDRHLVDTQKETRLQMDEVHSSVDQTLSRASASRPNGF